MTRKVVGLFVVALVLFAWMPSSASGALITYTNRATWQAAAGSTILEDFNTAALATYGSPFSVGGFNGFSLSGTHSSDTIGILAGGTPGNTDGSQFLGWSGLGGGPTFTVTFLTPVTAFGFDWVDLDGSDSWDVTIGGTAFQNPPFNSGGIGSGFFGVVDTAGDFSTAVFAQTLSGGVISPFGIDNLELAPVPEPSSLALVGAGLLGLVAVARRRRRRR